MATEKLANLAQSTLNTSINNSTTSVIVNSASSFPSTPQFRIAIDREIMLVTAIASNTFTVTRGAESSTAASHTSGANVIHVVTAGALNQIIADDCQRGAYASLPAVEKAGRLYATTDGVQLFRDNSSTWDAYGVVKPITIPPLSSAFTWDNQGTSTVADTAGTIYLSAAANDSNVVRGMYKSATPPYTLTVGLMLDVSWQIYNGYGIFFRESSSGKLHTLSLQYTGNPFFFSRKYTTSGSWSADYTSFPQAFVPWLRIADDNANRIMSVSPDGINWKQLHSIGRTDFLTANQVGFFLATEKGGGSTNVTNAMTIFSWTVA